MEKNREKSQGFTRKSYAVAYCAGSYEPQKRRYSHGVLIIDDGQQEHEICGSGMNEKYLDAQGLAGEIFGLLNAMDWAVSNGFSKLKLYFQTEQIGKWLTGEEKAESRATKMLRIIFETKYANLLHIELKQNELESANFKKAVELAEKAMNGGKRLPVSGDNWFVVDTIDIDKLKSIIQILKTKMKTLEIEEIDEPNKLRYNLAFAKSQLTVTLHKSAGQNLLVRGKDSILFQIFVTYLNEHGEIVIEKVLSDAYRKRIDPLVLDQQVAVFLPAIPHDLSNASVRLIRQAVINLTYFKENEEWLQFVLPVLRVMEVWWKANLNEKEVAKATDEYYVRMMSHFGSSRNSVDFINSLPVSKCISNKTDADNIIRNTLYDLNSYLVTTIKSAD